MPQLFPLYYILYPNASLTTGCVAFQFVSIQNFLSAAVLSGFYIHFYLSNAYSRCVASTKTVTARLQILFVNGHAMTFASFFPSSNWSTMALFVFARFNWAAAIQSRSSNQNKKLCPKESRAPQIVELLGRNDGTRAVLFLWLCAAHHTIIYIMHSSNVITLFTVCILREAADTDGANLVQQWRQIARGGVCARCALTTRVKKPTKTRSAAAWWLLRKGNISERRRAGSCNFLKRNRSLTNSSNSCRSNIAKI